MTTPIIPKGIDFMNWAAQTKADFSNLDIPNPTNEDEWINWAQAVLQNNQLATVPFPTELAYKGKDAWREWANYFIDAAFSSYS